MKPARVVLACLVAASALLGISTAQAQQIVPLEVGGRTVKVIIPSGFCVLPRTSAAGRDWYAGQELLNQGRNQVLLIYVSCSELAKAEKDPNYNVNSHGSYLAPLSKGKLGTLPPNYSRAKVLAEFVSVLPKVATQTPDNVNRRLAEVDFDKQLKVSGMHMGYLAHDENAVYAGIGSWVEVAGQKTRVLGVVGFTLANGLVVTNNLYGNAAATDFNRLLAVQKPLMKQLVAQN